MRNITQKRGLTLVEVMVAAAVFGFALLGVFGISRFMHRTAIDNVSDGIALQAVEGMMEQIRVMPYESTLLPAATSTGGAVKLTFSHYKPATTGAAAALVTQDIPVNATGYTAVNDVNLATTVDSNYRVTAQVPMSLGVRIVLTKVADTNFARGVTVELFYQYQAGPTDTVSDRAIRTFIPDLPH